MSEDEIGALIFGLGFCGLILFSIIYCIVSAIRESVLDKKYKNKYSRITEMKKQKGDMTSEHCRFWNTKILPLHNKIDALEKDLKYLPTKEKQQTIEKIEKLKEESFTLQREWELAGIVEDDLLKEITLAILKTNDKKYIEYNKKLNWVTDQDIKNLEKENNDVK